MGEAARPGLAERPIIAAPAIARPAIRVGSLPSVPAHVGTMLGLSVAGYGVALALVTGLQASSEAAVIADREPVAIALDQLAAGHDRLGRSIDDAAGLYAGAAAAYQSVVDRFAAIEEGLGALATSVKAVDGASKALPASVAMPVVRSVKVVAKATTHATSGGSAAP
jgi:hypothetical protein